MEHQNWKKTVVYSKHKSQTKNLQNKALTTKNVKAIRKPSGQMGGKKLNQILESDNMQVRTDDVGLKQAIIQGRAQSKMKQKELAQRMGVKESVIKNWEGGKEIPTNK